MRKNKIHNNLKIKIKIAHKNLKMMKIMKTLIKRLYHQRKKYLLIQ